MKLDHLDEILFLKNDKLNIKKKLSMAWKLDGNVCFALPRLKVATKFSITVLNVRNRLCWVIPCDLLKGGVHPSKTSFWTSRALIRIKIHTRHLLLNYFNGCIPLRMIITITISLETFLHEVEAAISKVHRLKL